MYTQKFAPRRIVSKRMAPKHFSPKQLLGSKIYWPPKIFNKCLSSQNFGEKEFIKEKENLFKKKYFKSIPIRGISQECIRYISAISEVYIKHISCIY